MTILPAGSGASPRGEGNRSLVDLQSYTVAEAVAEGITVACRLDNLTACCVNVPTGHTALQAAMPASCAFSTVSYTVCISSVTWPTATVRVISEQ